MTDRERRKEQLRKKRHRTYGVWIGTTIGIGCLGFFLGIMTGSNKAYEEKGDFQKQETSLKKIDEWENISLTSGDINSLNEENKYPEDKYKEVWKKNALSQTILVNKDNKLAEDYNPNLYRMPDGVNQAEETAYAPLCKMLEDGRKEGLRFIICSSYRSVERQQELLEEDIEILMKQGISYEDAYFEVTKETMPPGYSEHATGLAFDIVAKSYQVLDAGQEKTKENKWLQEHCAEYGFILRYPKGKEEITGVNYESWHFRYVGKEIASYITENGLTLEEYVKEINMN